MKDDVQNNMEQLITAFLLGSATPEEERTVLDWVAESRGNSRIFHQYKNIWDASHPAFQEKSIDREAAFARVQERLHKKNRISTSQLVLRIAAALAVPLAAFSIWASVTMHSGRILAKNEVRQTVFAPFSSRTQVVLSDGSKVWLNSGSSLEYPAVFRGKERAVALKGEAFFEVESSEKMPFIVKAGAVEVVATGTEFNVNAFAADSISTVSLRKGKVGVFSEGRRLSELNPGERLCYNSSNRFYSVRNADVEDDCIWKDGVLSFNNVPLERVFKRLGQLYNLNITISDPEIGRNMFKGTFDNEPVSEIMKIISMTTPIRYSTDSLSRPKRITVLPLR